MKKLLLICFSILLLLVLVYLLGPTAAEPNLNPTPLEYSISIDSIENEISNSESNFETLKQGNEAEIIWFNDSVSKTEYAVVYLHGFSASKREGNPVHRTFVSRYGCNLYLPRRYGHGLNDAEPLVGLTPENYLNSALKAVAVGKQIGEKVILMCTSTGGTLGLYIAAHDPTIEAVICYSPNIDFYDSNSRLLTAPWGLHLGRLLMGGKYFEYQASDDFKKYWQTKYRIEGLVSLRMLVERTMTKETFAAIQQPIFIGGYFQDKEHQDMVVSVEAMRNAIPLLGTSEDKKRFIAFSTVGAHVMTNPMRSTDIDTVLSETYTFAEQILNMTPR